MRKRTELINLDKIPSGTAQQRKMAVVKGRIMTYPSKTLEEARRIYARELKKLEKDDPYSGAIKLSIVFGYGTKEKKKIRQQWKTTKPDLDNIAKVFIDSLMHHGFIEEDSNIVQLSLTKHWDDHSYILFVLEEVENGC